MWAFRETPRSGSPTYSLLQQCEGYSSWFRYAQATVCAYRTPFGGVGGGRAARAGEVHTYWDRIL